MPEDYSLYVEHPRFGRSPRYTGLDPNPDSPEVNLHWNTGYMTEAQLDLFAQALERLAKGRERLAKAFGLVIPSAFAQFGGRECLIFGTAIPADLGRQTKATVPVTHYYDLDLECRDCGRRFIFFAEEQKYWYEELGFDLNSGCVRCHPCRKARHLAARWKSRFDELLHRSDRTIEESLEMADSCLHLIERGIFHHRQTQRVRQLLNQVARHGRSDADCEALRQRVLRIEEKGT